MAESKHAKSNPIKATVTPAKTMDQLATKLTRLVSSSNMFTTWGLLDVNRRSKEGRSLGTPVGFGIQRVFLLTYLVQAQQCQESFAYSFLFCLNRHLHQRLLTDFIGLRHPYSLEHCYYGRIWKTLCLGQEQ
jgi:hypothetical protein